MRSNRKKVLIGMAVGLLLVGGGAFGYVHTVGQVRAEAEAWQGQPPPVMQVDPEKAAKHIAEAFCIDESEVRAAIEAKRDFRDIGHAAMLAKISGESFKDVLALKRDGKDWREVDGELHITREQIRGVMMEIEARHLAVGVTFRKEKRWHCCVMATVALTYSKRRRLPMPLGKISSRCSTGRRSIIIGKMWRGDSTSIRSCCASIAVQRWNSCHVPLHRGSRMLWCHRHCRMICHES